MNVAFHPGYWLVDICSGSGMLGEALHCAMDGHIRTVAYVEREACAAAALVARMEDQALDTAPVWDDVDGLTSPEFFDYIRQFSPLAVTAGFPCQPFSHAGKRLGTEDERHLWPSIARFVEAAKPELVLLENVPGLKSALTVQHRRDIVEYLCALDAAAESQASARARWYAQAHRERLHGRLQREHGITALLYVLCDLERLGYRPAVGFYSAAEVGASHERERVFILAVAGGIGIESRRAECAGQQGRSETLQPGGEVGDATSRENHRGERGKLEREKQQGRGGDNAVDATGHPLADSEHADRWCELETGRTGFGRTELEGVGFELADATRERSESVWVPTGRGAEGSRKADPQRQGPSLADEVGQRLQGSQQSRAQFCLPLFAPGPGDSGAWGEILERFPEVEPGICRTADGVAGRLDPDRLRLTGNGVVPLAAAYAFLSLAAVHTRKRGLI